MHLEVVAVLIRRFWHNFEVFAHERLMTGRPYIRTDCDVRDLGAAMPLTSWSVHPLPLPTSLLQPSTVYKASGGH